MHYRSGKEHRNQADQAIFHAMCVCVCWGRVEHANHFRKIRDLDMLRISFP